MAEREIPVLTDLIESDVEQSIPADPQFDDDFLVAEENDQPYFNLGETLTDIGEEDDEADAPTLELARSRLDDPALEQEMRRIFDEHMELAWQEIRLLLDSRDDES